MNLHDHEQQKKRQAENEQLKIPRILMKEQHGLNDMLLKEQNKFNEKLHKEQAALTCQIQDRQETITIALAIFSLFVAILGAASGAYFAAKFQAQNQKLSQMEKLINKEPIASNKNVSSPNPTLNQTTNSVPELKQGFR
ncbi:hypothetical protein KAR91_83920 [Candidatus Pacearchaeota archaeon]|nr:hypothetical protein [Candidatus Pacearchaeota archaeon]